MPAFSNRPYADIVKAFQTPAHNAERVWTAVISSRYFKGSFDFESKEGARLYLHTQIERRGADAFNSDRDSVEFRSSFVINRETFEVFSLADLDLAFMRSNPWRKGRNACLTPAEHKARVARVAAYLETRKARATVAAQLQKGFDSLPKVEFKFHRFATIEAMKAFALDIVRNDQSEDRVFAESGIYSDNNGLTFRPQVSIVTESTVHVLRWNAFADQPEIDFLGKRARRDANDESGRFVDIIQTSINALYAAPSAAILQDIEGEGFDDAGVLMAPDCAYTNEFERGAYFKGWHARKAVNETRADGANNEESSMAVQYKVEISFPHDLGNVSGEYTGREKAIERCRYWLENGATAAKAISLMTGAIAFKGTAPRYAQQ